MKKVSDLQAIKYAAGFAWMQGPFKLRRLSKLEKEMFPSSSVKDLNSESKQFHDACIARLAALMKKLDKKSSSRRALVKN